jgi:hypothetical protein
MSDSNKNGRANPRGLIADSCNRTKAKMPIVVLNIIRTLLGWRKRFLPELAEILKRLSFAPQAGSVRDRTRSGSEWTAELQSQWGEWRHSQNVSCIFISERRRDSPGKRRQIEPFVGELVRISHGLVRAPFSQVDKQAIFLPRKEGQYSSAEPPNLPAPSADKTRQSTAAWRNREVWWAPLRASRPNPSPSKLRKFRYSRQR